MDEFQKLAKEEIKKVDGEWKLELDAFSHRDSVKDAVKGYVGRGWHVIPLHTIRRTGCSCGSKCSSPAKHPAVSRGVHDSRNRIPEALEWWTNDPDANIGIRTGEQSGLVVLDVDIKNGGDKTLAELETEYEKLPTTPTVQTGGGGSHYYFKHPGGEVKNSASRIGPGLDVRGDDGYVVAPPSLHATGNRYNWLIGPDTPLAELPQWLMDRIWGEKPVGQEPAKGAGVIYEGHRNDKLMSMAGSMRRAGLGEDAIYAALSVVYSERCKPPLSDDEVSGIAKSATRYAPAASEDGPGLILTPLSTITSKKLEWLWPNRIPLGKITLFVGSPGLGKTFLTLDIAARVSTGRAWPDPPGQPALNGEVIVMSAEDDLADTIKPRLMAAGADTTRISHLEGSMEEGEYSPFTLSRDVGRLGKLLDKCPDVRLLIIDPISAYLGRVDNHNDAEVRGVLSPLAKIAADHRVAVICVTHHNKSQNTTAAGKIMGSVAFDAAARQVWHVMQDPDDEDRRLFVAGKHNLTEAKTGLAFRLAKVPEDESSFGMPRVEFDRDPVLETADTLIAEERKKERGPNKTEQAVAFLQRELAQGPRELHGIEQGATAEGIKPATLLRARKRLKIDSDQKGKGQTRKTNLSLPDQAAA